MSHRSKESAKGTLVIIGGHEDKEADCVILKEVASHVARGRLVIATIASEEPESYFEDYEQTFGRLGVSDLVHIYLEDRVESSDKKTLKGLDDVKGVFFSGGDQLRICSQIGDTPFETRIEEIYEKGGVIAGTSAGASAMGEIMLIRGPNSESHRLGDIHMAPGLGLLRNVIIDQHFAERGRIGRLLGAVALNPRILGIGIDEDTAIVVQGNRFSVIGAGAVYVLDGAGVTRSNIAESAEERRSLSMHDVRLHVLSCGDAFDLDDRRPLVMQQCRVSEDGTVEERKSRSRAKPKPTKKIVRHKRLRKAA